MGKYSLESFERYPMLRCRPKEVREAMEGCGISAFTTVRMALGEDAPALTGRSLLEIHVPGGMPLPEAGECLSQLAQAYCGNPLALGVTVVTDADEEEPRQLWEAAAQAFAPKRYIVPVTDGEQLRFALDRGFAGGLLASVGGHPYDVCEAFAEHSAQQLYKRMPVLVRFAHAGAHSAQYAAQWHAAAVEGADAPAGYRIALRRLTLPKALSAGGFAPMRFWWTNRGPGCCYDRTQLRLRLARDGAYTDVPVHDSPALIALADRVHNEIVRLPDVEPGVYRLEYGLFANGGEALVLANEGRMADGYYPACEVTVDDVPRPEYEAIWDDFFPDGYYPLEDPKEPV